MKAQIHPEYMDTKVVCTGCGTKFDSRSTVAAIEVEICSQCHPFYTGKQKLVDTAGRVDKFNARRKAADELKAKAAPKKSRKSEEESDLSTELETTSRIAQEIKAETIETTPETEAPAEQ